MSLLYGSDICIRFKIVYLGCIALHCIELLFSPPPRYPDLYPVLNVLLSTPIFVLTWLWSIKSLFESYWAIGAPISRSSTLRATIPDSNDPSEAGTPAPEHGFTKGSSAAVGGIRREKGLRARSLGYGSGAGLGKSAKRASVAGSIDGVAE